MKKAHEKKNIPIEQDLKESIRKIKDGFMPPRAQFQKINEEQHQFMVHSSGVLVNLVDHYRKLAAQEVLQTDRTLAAIENFEPLLKPYLHVCKKKELYLYAFLLQELTTHVESVKEKLSHKK